MTIKGTVALVTGANRGMGKAFVRALLDREAGSVYAGARDPDEITEPDAMPLRLDITDPEQVRAAREHCSDVTLLINNAAVLTSQPLIGAATMDPARTEMETNYFGTLAMCRAFAPVLHHNGGGTLCNMLSIVSFLSVPSMGSFCASKAALWSMTNSLRAELAPVGTAVVAVHASFIDTDLAATYQGPKNDPADVAAQVLDGIEAGVEEILIDERTRSVKASLTRDLELFYSR